MSLMEIFGYGLFGGLLMEVLGLFKLRRENPQALPEWFKSPFYWIITALMICSGGGLAIIYSISDFAVSPIVALNIGASAPLIIERLASQIPKSIQLGNID